MFSIKWIVVMTVLLTGLGHSEAVTKSRSRRHQVPCRPKSLVRYKLTMRTLWSKKSFPKMFPTVRPPAQWSALVGTTHNADYTMWLEGENVTRSIQAIAENGDPRPLTRETAQGHYDILDVFTAPPVSRGAGVTSVVISLDGSHSQISFMMKLIPSPDWFIGLSKVNLCSRGRWRKNVHINLRPYDAGTSRGLTFTAPKWASFPQEAVTLITSQYPDHPASSFYYPNLKVLPRIAYVDLDLVSEYKLRKTFLQIKDPPVTTHKPKIQKPNSQHTDKVMQQDLPNVDNSTEMKDDKNENFSMDSPHFTVTSNKNTPSVDMKSTKKSDIPLKKHKSAERVLIKKRKVISNTKQSGESEQKSMKKDHTISSMMDALENIKDVNKNNGIKTDILKKKQITKNTTVESLSQEPTGSDGEPLDRVSEGADNTLQFEGVSTQVLQLNEGPDDCLMSEWSEWTPCSQTCGFGKKVRSREILAHPTGTGAPCPRAKQEALCGSMRDCAWDHFSFFGSKKRSRGRRPNRRKMTNRQNSTSAH